MSKKSLNLEYAEKLFREKLVEADKALRPLPYKIGINVARTFLLRKA